MNIISLYTELLSRYFPYLAVGLGGVVLVGLLISLVRQLMKSPKPQAPAPQKEPMVDANGEAQKILSGAREQAAEMIANAQAFQKNLDDEAKRLLEESIKKDAQILHEKAEELSSQYKNFFAKMQTDYFREVQQSLTEGRISIEKYLQQKIDAEFEEAKRQIKEYREAQIKKIEDLTIPAVSKIAKEVLGKSLSTSDHHEIIVNTLEKAKREGLFDF